MTRNQLVKEIARREGKRSESSIGNIREIIRCLEDMIGEEVSRGEVSVTLDVLITGASKKAEKLRKKKKKK